MSDLTWHEFLLCNSVTAGSSTRIPFPANVQIGVQDSGGPLTFLCCGQLACLYRTKMAKSWTAQLLLFDVGQMHDFLPPCFKHVGRLPPRVVLPLCDVTIKTYLFCEDNNCFSGGKAWTTLRWSVLKRKRSLVVRKNRWCQVQMVFGQFYKKNRHLVVLLTEKYRQLPSVIYIRF